MVSLGRIWNMDCHYVASLKEIIDRVCYLIAQSRDPARPDDIVAENVRLESHSQNSRNFVANPSSSSDNADPFRLQILAHQLTLYPPALLHAPVRKGNLAQEAEHQSDGQLRNTGRRRAWCVENCDSLIFSRLKVDIV